MAFPLNNSLISQSQFGTAPLNFPPFSKLDRNLIHELKHQMKGACNLGFNSSSSSDSVYGRNNRLVFTLSANASSAKTANPDIVQPQQNNTWRTPRGWAEFAKNVSGEWDGFGADFSKDGSPIELPESVVPEDYREWEVKVFDWQTQCPTLALALATDDDAPQLTYKVIRLLPTVGCEADAATRYSVEERSISGAAAFAYRSDGCYVAMWPGSDGMELEHCLVDPRDRESRVRIIQVLKRIEGEGDDEDEKGKEGKGNFLELRKIKVFCEQWYGPFRNGDQLGGCALRNSAFASTQPLQSSKVTGVWQAPLYSVASGFHHHHQEQDSHHSHNPNKVTREVVDEESVRKSFRDGSRLILLPKQLWCSLQLHTDEAENTSTNICCQVGWLLDDGVAITSKCFFSEDAQLKEIVIESETAESIQ